MADLEPLLLVLCDKAVLDGQGKPSLHGLFDVIWASGFPSQHPELTVFAQVRFREPGSTRIVVEAPDGTPVAVADACRSATPGKAQAICSFVRLPLPAAGEYTVRLVDDETTVAATSFEACSRQ